MGRDGGTDGGRREGQRIGGGDLEENRHFTEGKRPALLLFFRFYLHRELRAAGIRFLSTQRIGGGDLEENGYFLQRKRNFLHAARGL